MTRPLVRLMLVDGHDVIRRGVRQLFEQQDCYRIVAEARDGQEALRLAEETKPNLAIIDYMLPAFNGLALWSAMQSAGLQTKVLLYTMHDTPEIISNALESGIRGYVLKSDPEENLLVAVDALQRGLPFLSPIVSDTVLSRFLENEPRLPCGPLTQRERQIVQLIAEGGINKLVAHRLGVTVKTVETHRASAMRKLKIQSTAQLVRWAIRNNLIEP